MHPLGYASIPPFPLRRARSRLADLYVRLKVLDIVKTGKGEKKTTIAHRHRCAE